MASIRKRTLSSGASSYTVSWRDPDAGQRSRTFQDADKAQELKDFLDANGNSFTLATKSKKRKDSKAPTVHEVIARHLDELGGVKAGTLLSYRGQLQAHFTDNDFARTPVDQLTTLDVQTWHDNLDRAPKTKKNLQALLSAALKREAARTGGAITRNVAEGVRGPKSTRKTRTPMFLTQAEETAVLEAIENPDSRFFVEFMLQTGMRIGESSAHKADHHEIVQFPVRQADGSIEIEERVQVIVLEAFERHAGKGVGTPLGAPKTRKGTRSITLSKKFGERYLRYIAKKRPGQFVFTRTGTDLPISSVWFYDNIWNPAVDPLVESGALRRRATAHDLRHTHVSKLIARGATIKAIQDRVGHEDFSTTANTYGHLENTADMIAADSLDL